MQRYLIDQPTPANHQLVLPDDVAHHFVTVLRAQGGEECEIVLNDQRVYRSKLTQLEPATVELIEQLDQDAELPIHVTLACGLPKTKDKPELIVQKGTEMGADAIIFFESARSVSHWNSQKQAKKVARLQKIADGAAEQSHRNRVPSVSYLPDLKTLLERVPTDQRVVAWEESAKQGEESRLAQLLRQAQSGDRWLAIFGPEGGLTTEEIAVMEQSDTVPVGLGPRILRTETAPLYFMAAVSFALELS
ncbi:16S rRNA (uracil(1498)-N(3))-methyltransferase [Limosilactobacillus caecicola]|uniref:16S rRNA (uracil(1498)-N(3))-methyltransferase n=1 Tax=Limosilactobacillus caecicola TaxID=2941332 RepID=UPI00203D825E|nr:16S rRNA (uracil(1498)-N(3))-methyltransferase [Limosilactobacillus caecicola]